MDCNLHPPHLPRHPWQPFDFQQRCRHEQAGPRPGQHTGAKSSIGRAPFDCSSGCKRSRETHGSLLCCSCVMCSLQAALQDRGAPDALRALPVGRVLLQGVPKGALGNTQKGMQAVSKRGVCRLQGGVLPGVHLFPSDSGVLCSGSSRTSRASCWLHLGLVQTKDT